MTIGIYKLNFTGTDKVYIGKSSNIESRFSGHKAKLLNNKHSIKMTLAYKEFGMPTLEILCECLAPELNLLENAAILAFNAVDNGFNTLYHAEDMPKGGAPTGELHGNSKYSNKHIIEVFNMLVDTNLSLNEIANITKTSYDVVSTISCGKNHTWLAEEFPDKYTKLSISRVLKGQASPSSSPGELNVNSIYSNAQVISVFNMLVDSPTINLKRVSDITRVSYGVVKSISKGANHKWLSKDFPERYERLMSLKGKRRRITD